ncbi:hypothetical protein [Dasineura jujubifolia toursvirus 2a]|nr:hypothetical protein [Dasineura jujubifolia toursvirus 2a]
MVHVRLTNEQKLEIYNRVTSGDYRKNLAIEYGVNVNTITNICKKLNAENNNSQLIIRECLKNFKKIEKGLYNIIVMSENIEDRGLIKKRVEDINELLKIIYAK